MSEALREAAEKALEMLGHCTPDKRYGDDYLEREFAELNAVRKALRAALAKPEQSEPLFWYRPMCGGEMYQGPHHNKSIGGKMIRDEQPGQWLPLFANPPHREPLSDDKRAYMLMENLGPLALTGGKMTIFDAFNKAIDATEAAHGITGEKT